MYYPPMIAQRKADVIANDLLDQIVTGGLGVGSLLPKEPELAAAYGVNKSVVREAVKQLEVHRLVAPVRRRGTVVLDPLESLTPEVLRAMLVPGGKRVDAEVLRSILEVRAQIDEQMNAIAAERRNDADLAALAAATDVMESSLGSASRFAAAAEAFGLTIARATHNPIFVMMVNWQRHIFRDLEPLLGLARVPSDAHVQGARALVLALRARDVETARALTRAFHQYAVPVLLAGATRAEAPPLQQSAPPAKQTLSPTKQPTSKRRTRS